MKRIYADFNDIDEMGVLSLTCQGSLDSIAQLSEMLQEGEEVCLSDSELEVIGRVFRRHDGSWEARSTWAFVSIDTSYVR